MPTFHGYATPRYQEHDSLIQKLVKEFNSNKAVFTGSSASQTKNMPDLSEALVKSWIIKNQAAMTLDRPMPGKSTQLKSMYRVIGHLINSLPGYPTLHAEMRVP